MTLAHATAAAASTATITTAPVLALVPVRVEPTAPEAMFGMAAFVSYAGEDGALVRVDRTIGPAQRDRLVREQTRLARAQVAAAREAARVAAERKARLDALVAPVPAALRGLGSGVDVWNDNRGRVTNATRRKLRAMMAATA